MYEGSKRMIKQAELNILSEKIKLVVKDRKEAFEIFETDMMGAITYLDQPALNLTLLPILIEMVLNMARGKNWEFGNIKSFSIYTSPYFLVVLGEKKRPLIPAISGECRIANEEADYLNKMISSSFEEKFKPEYILPKLIWLLKKEPDLHERIKNVMTLGAYIGYGLTGIARQPISEIENIFVTKKIKECEDKWFPYLIESEERLGKITSAQCNKEWLDVIRLLEDADFHINSEKSLSDSETPETEKLLKIG